MMFGEEVHVRPFQIPHSRFQTPDSSTSRLITANSPSPRLTSPQKSSSPRLISCKFLYHQDIAPKFLNRRDSFHANSLTVVNLSLQVFSLLKSYCNIGVLFWNLGILESWNLESGILESWNLESGIWNLES